VGPLDDRGQLRWRKNDSAPAASESIGIWTPPAIAHKSAREITFAVTHAYYPMQTFTFSAIPREVYGFWMKPETCWPLNRVMASDSL
jgi:hypothetical protein